MSTVAVTGASGYLGRKLLERLGADPGVSRVIGVDVVEPGFSTRNLEFYRLDVRSAELAEVIKGCDSLVHLAFVQSGRAVDEMRDSNVGGTRLTFEAAAAAGVRKVVYVSDAVVYGAHPDNDFPLTEESPLRPIHDLPYAMQKSETEEFAKAFATSHPDVVVTVLRPCAVLGPTVSGPAARLVESPLALLVTGYDPPTQVVHEDDAAKAMTLAIEHDLPGVYNLCPEESLALSAIVRILGQRRVVVTRERAGREFERLWRLHLSELHPADVQYLMYPWVATSAKLTASGFEFGHTARQALDEAAAARKGWVSVGNLHFRPRRVALIAGTLGAAAFGSAARSAVSRRRARPEKA